MLFLLDFGKFSKNSHGRKFFPFQQNYVIFRHRNFHLEILKKIENVFGHGNLFENFLTTIKNSKCPFCTWLLRKLLKATNNRIYFFLKVIYFRSYKFCEVTFRRNRNRYDFFLIFRGFFGFEILFFLRWIDISCCTTVLDQLLGSTQVKGL